MADLEAGTEGSTHSQRLAQAHACHDDDPATAAALLRSVSPAALAANERPTFAFLLNHVLGEKLKAWPEALQLHRQALALPGATHGSLRLAAAAASAAGDDEASGQFTAAYAQAMKADPARAEEVVLLTAATCTVMHLSPAEAAALTDNLLQRVQHAAWEEPTVLDSALAACLNNLAGALQERPPEHLAEPALRSALVRSAEQAHRFWSRAGTWVHVERALYLRATIATALGDFAAARAWSAEALALIDANDSGGSQAVDKAFLELERGNACERLGLVDEGRSARLRAELQAAMFDDPGLKAWFASRRAALAGEASGG